MVLVFAAGVEFVSTLLCFRSNVALQTRSLFGSFHLSWTYWRLSSFLQLLFPGWRWRSRLGVCSAVFTFAAVMASRAGCSAIRCLAGIAKLHAAVHDRD